MLNRLATQRLIALFCAGVLLFNFPLLALWNRDALLLGVPWFPAALFIVWAALIAALGWIVEHEPGRDAPDSLDAGGAAPAAPESDA